jgi:hypothetical protein
VSGSRSVLSGSSAFSSMLTGGDCHGFSDNDSIWQP